jgi:hypothetical protein
VRLAEMGALDHRVSARQPRTAAGGPARANAGAASSVQIGSGGGMLLSQTSLRHLRAVDSGTPRSPHAPPQRLAPQRQVLAATAPTDGGAGVRDPPSRQPGSSKNPSVRTRATSVPDASARDMTSVTDENVHSSTSLIAARKCACISGPDRGLYLEDMTIFQVATVPSPNPKAVVGAVGTLAVALLTIVTVFKVVGGPFGSSRRTGRSARRHGDAGIEGPFGGRTPNRRYAHNDDARCGLFPDVPEHTWHLFRRKLEPRRGSRDRYC